MVNNINKIGAALLFLYMLLARAPTAYAVDLSVDEEMRLFQDLVNKGFSFAAGVCVILAFLYWANACVRYVTEDSDDAARKHLLRASMGLFVAVSARKIVGFVINAIFEGQITTTSATGTEALKSFGLIAGRTITAGLTIAMVLAGGYWVVIAIKMAFADDSRQIQKHLVRATIGLLGIITARALFKWLINSFV